MIFVCDVMLGKLARYLRMLGLDAAYVRRCEGTAFHTGQGQSLFFTRSPARMDRPGCVLVHSDDPHEQVLEIKEHIRPYIDHEAFMTRCLECNVLLAEAKKEDVEPLLPEYIYHHHERFMTCPSCHKIYWEGSHADEMMVWIQDFWGSEQ